jgi:transport and Golgi organization protein 2
MCTVSWVHEPDGYHLFCNRDEKRSRAIALPPRIQARGWVRFIAPVDPDSGGTWITVNEFGVSACVLNGANLTRLPLTSNGSSKTPRSRGLFLRNLVWANSTAECTLWMNQLDLTPFSPFTVLFLEPRSPATIAEWNGEHTTTIRSGDSHMPLTSSSFDPERARTIRLNELAGRVNASGRIDDAVLQAFHSSHGEQPDAYSACMHRADAETVSFSSVIVTRDDIRFLYSSKALCKTSKCEQEVLRRAA